MATMFPAKAQRRKGKPNAITLRLCGENLWLAPDTIKVLLAANEDPAVRDRRRRIHRLSNRIRAEDLVLRTGLHHERVAIFAGHQNLSFKRHRRGSESRRNRNSSAFIFDFACPGIKADRKS